MPQVFVGTDNLFRRTVLALMLLGLVAFSFPRNAVFAEDDSEEVAADEEAVVSDDDAEDDEEGEAKAKPQLVEKSLSEMTLDELQNYQSFTYLPGGRDPLTFREVTVEVNDEEQLTQHAQRPKQMINVFEPPAKAEQIEFMEEQILLIELHMLAHDFAEVIRICENVDAIIAGDWGGSPTADEASRLWRRVRAYQNTAKRLFQARETEREFNDLGLEVMGIRWTPQGASALIQEKIYEPGELVENLATRAQVQIEAIEESAVVFIFKGQRFRKMIGRPVEGR